MMGELAGTAAWMWPTTTPMATRQSSWLRPVFLRTSSISSAPMLPGTVTSAIVAFSSAGPGTSRDSGLDLGPAATSSAAVGSGDGALEGVGWGWEMVVWAARRGTGGGVGEQLGPSSDGLEPVQSVSREALLAEEPLDAQLLPHGVALRPPRGKKVRLR